MSESLLLADADVLIQFYRGNRLELLPDILPKKLVLLDAVAAELKRGPNIYPRVIRKIGGQITEMSFDDKDHVREEWVKLLSERVGPGESACLALARYEGHHVLSSNLRDIDKYCKQHRVRIYTTMDLIHEAHKKGLLTQLECNEFVYDAIDGGSNLPRPSFDLYLQDLAHRAPWTKYDQI